MATNAEKCDYLAPRHGSVFLTGVGEEDDCYECLMNHGHGEVHLCKISSGKYVVWMPLDPCDGSSPWYAWGYVSEEVAKKFVTRDGECDEILGPYLRFKTA